MPPGETAKRRKRHKMTRLKLKERTDSTIRRGPVFEQGGRGYKDNRVPCIEGRLAVRIQKYSKAWTTAIKASKFAGLVK